VSEKPYTPQERRQFKRILDQTGSLSNYERISARLAMERFVADHGKAKCQAMYDAIMRREAKAWDG
jgi:hypothetical protein